LGPSHVVVAALVLFAVRLALGLHGFSLPEWHRTIDGSPAPEILVGQSRAIRGDDWAVILPMIFAQRAHRPPFPTLNSLIGDGQSMVGSYSFPVVHAITFFRPQVWGYFLGADIGLAWHWGMLGTGLFLA